MKSGKFPPDDAKTISSKSIILDFMSAAGLATVGPEKLQASANTDSPCSAAPLGETPPSVAPILAIFSSGRSTTQYTFFQVCMMHDVLNLAIICDSCPQHISRLGMILPKLKISLRRLMSAGDCNFR